MQVLPQGTSFYRGMAVSSRNVLAVLEKDLQTISLHSYRGDNKLLARLRLRYHDHAPVISGPVFSQDGAFLFAVARPYGLNATLHVWDLANLGADAVPLRDIRLDVPAEQTSLFVTERSAAEPASRVVIGYGYEKAVVLDYFHESHTTHKGVYPLRVHDVSCNGYAVVYKKVDNYGSMSLCTDLAHGLGKDFEIPASFALVRALNEDNVLVACSTGYAGETLLVNVDVNSSRRTTWTLHHEELAGATRRLEVSFDRERLAISEGSDVHIMRVPYPGAASPLMPDRIMDFGGDVLGLAWAPDNLTLSANVNGVGIVTVDIDE